MTSTDANLEDGLSAAHQQLSERGGVEGNDEGCNNVIEDVQYASLAFKELLPFSAESQLRKRESGAVEESCNGHWYSCSLPRLSCCPLTAAIVLGLLTVVLGRTYLEEILEWLEDLSLLNSLLVFTALFTMVSFPFGCGYVIINMAAGYIHGVVEGQVLVVVAVAIGFSIAFLLCRSCLRIYAQSKLSSHMLALVRVVEGRHGFKVILLTRLTPIPFGMQNTLFAVSLQSTHQMTNVSYINVLCASILGLLPTQILNTYMGSTLRSIREVLADRADTYIILSFQIIISILLTLYLVRKARFELSRMNTLVDIEKGEDEDG